VTPGTVSFVVPEGIDDASRVSGGNVFDRRLRDGLVEIGWRVQTTEVEIGSEAAARAALEAVPDGGIALVDGLVAGRAPAAIEDAAGRLRIVVLAHMVSAAFGDAGADAIDGERRALRAAHEVIVTSPWTRTQLVERQVAPLDRVVVAVPGVDALEPAIGTDDGGSLLCVGVVAPHKGQDLLIEALADLGPRAPWRCRIVGSLDADSAFADALTARARENGIADRVTMTGVLTEDELDAAYRRTDLLVAPSRVESYGMAIADALRRGIPVVATAVGGIPLTVAPTGAAILVPPDADALSEALGRWMTDPALRETLRAEARRGGPALPTWADTVDRVADALAGIA
jgi:glycosyltransferase involved in cell wall biosynthesis